MLRSSSHHDNPRESTFESIKPLLEEAHSIALGRIKRRKIRSDGRD
jgi:hypothetical protein